MWIGHFFAWRGWMMFSLLAVAPLAHAQVFRCETGGKVEYRSTPCEGTAQERTLPGVRAGGVPATAASATPAGIASAADTPAQAREREACDQLARDYEATAAEIRHLWGRLRQERAMAGSTLGAHRLNEELGKQRVRRTMLAQAAYPRCPFAQKGQAFEVARGKLPTENEENGLSEPEARACQPLQVELNGLRTQTGYYFGRGYGPISRPGENTELIARQMALEQRMLAMRCPQHY